MENKFITLLEQTRISIELDIEEELFWKKIVAFYGRFAHENILLARTSMHNILGGRKALLANGK
jgi:uncharacterized protein (DUF924 family)